MTGLDIVLACLLGAFQCKNEIMQPPQGINGPQIVNICPDWGPKDGSVAWKYLMTDSKGNQVLVLLSCPVDG